MAAVYAHQSACLLPYPTSLQGTASPLTSNTNRKLSVSSSQSIYSMRFLDAQAHFLETADPQSIWRGKKSFHCSGGDARACTDVLNTHQLLGNKTTLRAAPACLQVISIVFAGTFEDVLSSAKKACWLSSLTFQATACLSSSPGQLTNCGSSKLSKPELAWLRVN